MAHRVLIIDDEAGIRQALKQVLEYEGMQVRAASSGGGGITVFPEYRPHLSFLDVKMAGLDGLDTLTRLRELDPNALVVMISGHGTMQTAVEATRRGAFDFLEKPLDTDRLLVTVRNGLDHASLVGDGLCDCCDGSDEWQTTTPCVNTCMEEEIRLRCVSGGSHSVASTHNCQPALTLHSQPAVAAATTVPAFVALLQFG